MPCRSPVSSPGTRAPHCSGRKAGGRKFSKASQLVRTRRPILSGWLAAVIWEIAPPVSLATSDDVLELEGLEQIGDEARESRGREVSVRVHRRDVGPERQVGDDAAEPILQQRGHLAPEAAVDEQPVDEDDGRALTRLAIPDRALREFRFAHSGLLKTRFAVRIQAVCITDLQAVCQCECGHTPRGLQSKAVFRSVARIECDEDRNPSRVRSLARPLFVRERLLHPLHQARAACGDLLAVPSLLHGQAEAG